MGGGHAARVEADSGVEAGKEARRGRRGEGGAATRRVSVFYRRAHQGIPTRW
jgi:hypothetical protein